MASASKRVLITGLDSFTGRHLGRYLSGAGYQVFGTSRQSGNADNLWQCDIADADIIMQVLFDEPDAPQYGVTHRIHFCTATNTSSTEPSS